MKPLSIDPKELRKPVNTDLSPRDMYYRVMRFQCPGRTLATLAGMWPSTLDRWVKEGMPEEWRDLEKMTEYFGLQPHLWLKPKAYLETYPEFERKVLRETAETVTYVDHVGIITTDFKEHYDHSMPHFESYPIKTRDDWKEYKKRLVWCEERVGEDWQKQKRELCHRTVPLVMPIHWGSLYGSLRDLMGVEALSYLFYDDPALVAEIMDTMVELFCHSVDALFSDFTPDGICLWEDMAYKTGSLLGIRHVRELMLPRYKIMTAKCREKEIPFIFLDSDGYIEELIPIWLDAGIDGVVPMEAQAGMDVALYRERYPTMLMIGGVDKKALAAGKEAIDREMDKIRRAIARGGYIPFFDHGLPFDVSYDKFLYFVQQLKKTASGQVD